MSILPICITKDTHAHSLYNVHAFRLKTNHFTQISSVLQEIVCVCNVYVSKTIEGIKTKQVIKSSKNKTRRSVNLKSLDLEKIMTMTIILQAACITEKI